MFAAKVGNKFLKLGLLFDPKLRTRTKLIVTWILYASKCSSDLTFESVLDVFSWHDLHMCAVG